MKTIIKNAMILTALILTVLILLVSYVAVAYADDLNVNFPTFVNLSEKGFFKMLREYREKWNCYIEVSKTEELLLAVICYGPETPDEYTIDLVVYNKTQEKALWIGDFDITSENLKSLEDIGIDNPKQYIHEDVRLGIDVFKVFCLGEEINWN